MSVPAKQVPQEGDEVTVIIIMPDGTELVSTGTFERAEWNTDLQEAPRTSWDPWPAEYIKGETTLDLRLRRVNERKVSPEVAQGRRRLGP